jgi:hypothetical protein
MANFAIKSLKAKKAVVLIDNGSDYSKGLAKNFKATFTSAGGKIVDEEGIAFSVVEGLILDSLNTSYLNLHLDKIFKYDTTGLEYNFIISYVCVSDFSSFWNKYCDHIKMHEFQYPLQEFNKDVYRENYAEIKTGLSSHLRSGNIVYLYHICHDYSGTPLGLLGRD